MLYLPVLELCKGTLVPTPCVVDNSMLPDSRSLDILLVTFSFRQIAPLLVVAIVGRVQILLNNRTVSVCSDRMALSPLAPVVLCDPWELWYGVAQLIRVVFRLIL